MFQAPPAAEVRAPHLGDHLPHALRSTRSLLGVLRRKLQCATSRIGHSAQEEIVEISVEILFTPSYGAVLFVPTDSRSGSPQGYRLRSYDFWKDVQARVFEGDQERIPERHRGEPNYFCGEGGCTLIGATLHLEFPATLFTSDTVTVRVFPPDGPEVSVDFDIATLR